MRYIYITVDSNGGVTTDTKQLGYSGEHNAVQLLIEFSTTNDSFLSSDYYRIIIDGRYSDALHLSDGALIYSVPQECMCPPRVQCQVVGYKEGEQAPEIIMKSQVFSFDVDRSQTSIEAVFDTPDVFERALEACKKASDDAVRVGEYANEAAKCADDAKTQRATAALSAISASQSAESAAKSAEVVAQAEFELNNICNALKGSGSGNVVALKDVSPLPHGVSVKVSGVESTGETLTKTETVSEQGATVTLDTPAPSVRVVISGGAYCIAGIIPTVDGDDLTALSDFSALEIVPHGSYAEIGAIYDLAYTIEGNVLSWTGSWMYSDTEVWGDKATEVSGSYTLSSSGQKITGFYQVYALDDTNPHYVEYDIEYMELNTEISLYEGESVLVTVHGKNLVDWSNVNKWSAAFWRLPQACIEIPVTAGVEYYISFDYTKTPSYFYLFRTKADGTVDSNYPLEAFSWENVRMKEYSFTALEGRRYFLTSALASNNVNATSGLFDRSVFQNYLDKFKYIQVEVGTAATDYEPYIESRTYKATADGTVEGVESVYPSMTFTTDTEGAELEVEYNRDINKAFAELQAAIVSMGGNV